MHHRHTQSDTPILQVSAGKENVDVRRKSVQHDLLPGPQSPMKPAASIAQDSYRPEIVNWPSHENGINHSSSGSSLLTLIRRYDGFQSNVGRVIVRADRGTDLSNTGELTVGTNLLEIMTPGYEPFSLPNTQSSMGVCRDTSSTSPLTRTLHTADSLKRTDRSMYRYSSTILNSRGSEENNGRQNFLDQGSSGKKHALRSCQFDSLWGGRCDFSSGVVGNSLKCKHTPRPGQDPHDLSELRFNLPGSVALGPNPKRPRLGGSSSESKRTSFLTKYKRQHSSSSSLVTGNVVNNEPPKLEERMGRLDLSLGQELAGGGFGGKQAKLGKLIIEPEGLKMLDLVVAANMAIWWKIYEELV